MFICDKKKRPGQNPPPSKKKQKLSMGRFWLQSRFGSLSLLFTYFVFIGIDLFKY